MKKAGRSLWSTWSMHHAGWLSLSRFGLSRGFRFRDQTGRESGRAMGRAEPNGTELRGSGGREPEFDPRPARAATVSQPNEIRMSGVSK